MVPTRGADAALGATRSPSPRPPRATAPFVLDMATTTVAANKVKVYDLNGKPIPEGWVVDEAGGPSRTPRPPCEIIFERAGGGVTPLGGAEVTGGTRATGSA